MTTSRILQNNLLLWLDANIDESKRDIQQALQQLRIVIHHVNLFTQVDRCVQFLERVKKEQVLVITSGSLGQDLVQRIHGMPQVEAIYIFCDAPARHKSWTSKWSKIRGVFSHIRPICDALQAAVKQSNEDLTPISFVTQRKSEGGEKNAEVDLNRLEPSFMYTTLFKRILLKMKHEPHERQAIVKVCRRQYADNTGELAIVEEFDREYRPDQAVWWYTRECFTYQMLNRALRLLESDIIIDMGFFINDLHRQLEQLHREQFGNYHGPSLTLYRGQRLSTVDFAKLKRSGGGLIAFNNFLSTSWTKAVSLDFARQSATAENMVGVLFVMTIDPTIPTATFADIEKHSYYKMEKEVLCSMHTVFRVNEVIGLDKGARLFEIRLTLAGDDDLELRQLTDRLEEGVGGGTGWHQLGRVLIDLKQMKKAEELYLALLGQKPSARNEGLYYHCLGVIKAGQGDYKEAVRYNEQAIAIYEKILSPTDPELAISYNNMGDVYKNMGEYSRALSYDNKALGIREKTLPANHSDLATSYCSIGLVYYNMGEYSQALCHYNKALVIQEKTLLANHPWLATSYNNIGLAYNNMGEHSQALSYHNKALGIREKILPANHPDMAQSYNNIGLVYKSMGEYSQALSYYNKTRTILETTLPANHPHLASSYNNIGMIYYKLSDYSSALLYFQKAYDIKKNSLPPGHPSIEATLKWLDDVKKKL